MVDKKWKWVAKDADSNMYFFSELPECMTRAWAINVKGTTQFEHIRCLRFDGDWKDSLHEIIHHEDGKIEFRKARPELKVDDPVWVRDTDGCEWVPRHFAGWDDRGRILVWLYGHTSFTAQGDEEEPVSYLQYKLP